MPAPGFSTRIPGMKNGGSRSARTGVCWHAHWASRLVLIKAFRRACPREDAEMLRAETNSCRFGMVPCQPGAVSRLRGCLAVSLHLGMMRRNPAPDAECRDAACPGHLAPLRYARESEAVNGPRLDRSFRQEISDRTASAGRNRGGTNPRDPDRIAGSKISLRSVSPSGRRRSGVSR